MVLSTTKVEYVVTGSCCVQFLWIKQQLVDFGLIFDHIPIKCDKTSLINITKNPMMPSKTKHIEIRHHFIRDHVQKGDITLEFLSIDL